MPVHVFSCVNSHCVSCGTHVTSCGTFVRISTSVEEDEGVRTLCDIILSMLDRFHPKCPLLHLHPFHPISNKMPQGQPREVGKEGGRVRR